MGIYCCCGVKKREGWICQCDWDGWFLCWEQINNEVHSIPVPVPFMKIPDKEGIYKVRVFESKVFEVNTFIDLNDYETESEFSLIKKNWGELMNKAISHWKITYDDEWMEYRDVYAWKGIN